MDLWITGYCPVTHKPTAPTTNGAPKRLESDSTEVGRFIKVVTQPFYGRATIFHIAAKGDWAMVWLAGKVSFPQGMTKVQKV